MTDANENPYILTADRAEAPPTTFFGRMRMLGPGLILTASIVGSGELIGTTLFGARAGFICFWVILLSCLVKVALQIEFGKYALYTGKSTMAALNGLPGPRLGRVSWAIWVWLMVMLLKILQVGGIIGGVAILLSIAFPSVPVLAWLPALVIATGALVSRGYGAIEKASIFLTAVFTASTMVSLFALQGTPLAVTGAELISGFKFGLPKEIIFYAWAAFGITGIGGDEILTYNYWLIEKGYAAKTGPREDSPEWVARAKGWIEVMKMDALVSMVVYTVVTAAFYLLGAAVLHRLGELPKDDDLLKRMSLIYTESLGAWAKWLYLAGAIAALGSTLLAATAAWARQFSDAAGQFGFTDFLDPVRRKRAITFFTWLLPCIWALVFCVVQNSALMVLIGGAATMAVLFVVVFASIWFRLKLLPPALKPGRVYDILLTLSILAIMAVGVQALVSSITKVAGW
jgi:Mn2+/Fe2+ NRAMP family transporter